MYALGTSQTAASVLCLMQLFSTLGSSRKDTCLPLALPELKPADFQSQSWVFIFLVQVPRARGAQYGV